MIEVFSVCCHGSLMRHEDRENILLNDDVRFPVYKCVSCGSKWVLEKTSW